MAAVPAGQAKFIRSSDYSPPFASVASAMPTAQAIKLAFDHLRSVATPTRPRVRRSQWTAALPVFAGHGFAPAHDDNLTALTADASIATGALSHVVGPYIADYFRRTTFFEEVLMFAWTAAARSWSAPSSTCRTAGTGQHSATRSLAFAYGARVAKASREWKMPDGQYSYGVFTRTLIDALRGARMTLPTRRSLPSIR
jgi:hypothetical protein